MKWITRQRIHVNRTATVWLIRRFLDPDAEIAFVEPAAVAGAQEQLAAIGFDAPGAIYPHRDAEGRCSFEKLVDERLSGDPRHRVRAKAHLEWLRAARPGAPAPSSAPRTQPASDGRPAAREITMRQKTARVRLSRETLRRLEENELRRAAGAALTDQDSCSPTRCQPVTCPVISCRC
jgi:Chromate resistance exported protein